METLFISGILSHPFQTADTSAPCFRRCLRCHQKSRIRSGRQGRHSRTFHPCHPGRILLTCSREGDAIYLLFIMAKKAYGEQTFAVQGRCMCPRFRHLWISLYLAIIQRGISDTVRNPSRWRWQFRPGCIQWYHIFRVPFSVVKIVVKLWGGVPLSQM